METKIIKDFLIDKSLIKLNSARRPVELKIFEIF